MQKAEADARQEAAPTSSTMATTTVFPLLAALYYIATSVSLTLFNKLLFARFPASDPPFLLLSQSLTTVAILSAMRLVGKFSPPSLRSWTAVSIRTYAPLYVSNLAMLLTSLIALKFTSLLMYNTLRRTSMIFVVAIHCGMHRVRPTSYTVAATAFVTIGALLASSSDLAYDPLGYALAFTANISTAIYLVLLRPVRDKLQLSNLQLLYVNALANIPVLAIIILAMPPKDGVLALFSNLTFSILFLCSCSFAVVINHAIFVNTTTNDAIAQSISSQLKDVVLLITSIAFVDDPKQRAAGNLQGVFVGFLGSLVYGVGKLVDKRRATQQPIEPTSKEDEKTGDAPEKVTLINTRDEVKVNS